MFGSLENRSHTAFMVTVKDVVRDELVLLRTSFQQMRHLVLHEAALKLLGSCR